MANEDVLEKVQQLLDERNYFDVASHMPDDLLLERKDPVLYWKRAFSFIHLGEYEKAMDDLQQAIELNPQFSDALINIGYLYKQNDDPEKAIEYYTRAAEADPTKWKAFYNRAIAWMELREYDKALEDYGRAINIDPTNSELYYARGYVYSLRGDTGKAVMDYGRSIKLKPQFVEAYQNRGEIWRENGNYDYALADFKKAAELRPEVAENYRLIGDTYTLLGNYKEALRYYELALEREPDNRINQLSRDETLARLGQQVDKMGQQEESVYYVENELIGFLESEKTAIRQACSEINSRVELIRRLILYKGHESLVHYTKLGVADILVAGGGKMRYSNVVFMNDPEEGKAFINYLDDINITDAFQKGNLTGENNVYLGSFLPQDKADYLVMWRTYGRSELNEEAAGCSITVSRDFFDNEDGSLFSITDKDSDNPSEKQALYHVVYYDKDTGELVNDESPEIMKELNKAVKELKTALLQLLALKNPDDHGDLKRKNIVINKFVYRYLSELRYFFKSSNYQFEKELRVIKYYLPGNSIVKVNTTGTELPRRMYIESTKPARPYISKVILGPKVAHPERWTYLEAIVQKEENHSMILKPSECKFQ